MFELDMSSEQLLELKPTQAFAALFAGAISNNECV